MTAVHATYANDARYQPTTQYEKNAASATSITVAIPYNLFVSIARMSVASTELSQYNWVYVAPLSLAANLAASAVAMICGVINLVAAPIFLCMAACHSDKNKREFFLVRATLSAIFGVIEALGSIPFALMNTVNPSFLNSHERNLRVNLNSGLALTQFPHQAVNHGERNVATESREELPVPAASSAPAFTYVPGLSIRDINKARRELGLEPYLTAS